jgi:predicted ATPase
MKISRLKIKNFRSIQELDIELPQVCAGRENAAGNGGREGLLSKIKHRAFRHHVSFSIARSIPENGNISRHTDTAFCLDW